MQGWIIIVAAASVALTAALTWVLWRLNAGGDARKGGDGDNGSHPVGAIAPRDRSDPSDAGGGDGGDGGGGDGGGGD
jgi:hypothetical protein